MKQINPKLLCSQTRALMPITLRTHIQKFELKIPTYKLHSVGFSELVFQILIWTVNNYIVHHATIQTHAAPAKPGSLKPS
jgi:hypothetical protein